MMYRRVLLPAPDGPIIASASPRDSERFTFERIDKSPPAVGNDLLTFATKRSSFVILLFPRHFHQFVRICRRHLERFEFPSPVETTEDCLEFTRRQFRLPPAEVE